MIVSELIDELHTMPPTAVVQVQIRRNVGYENGKIEDLQESRDAPIESVTYSLGEVWIRLEE